MFHNHNFYQTLKRQNQVKWDLTLAFVILSSDLIHSVHFQFYFLAMSSSEQVVIINIIIQLP